MARKWIKAIPPQMMHDKLGLYQGQWFPEMDRCWVSDDGKYSVCSRLLNTEWGKVEHVTIQLDKDELTTEGEGDIPWKEKQAIKDELFGVKRMAIEVFPTADRMIDQCDVYHLWVFEKGFRLPFGIHPKEANLTHTVHRGYSFTQEDATALQEVFDKKKELQSGK